MNIMPHVTLPKVGTDKAWREAARACVRAGLRPEQVSWSRGAAESVLFGEDEAPPSAKAGPIRVPEGFVDLAAQVCWHRDPERFGRLYAFLWRLRGNPKLMQDPADRDLAALRSLERAVRRDLHKLRTSVRFREIGERTAPRRCFAAWFEPAHHTLEPAAPFFARRFADMDVSIATPDLVLRSEGGAVRFEEGVEAPDFGDEAAEELWLGYFRRILDPTRTGMDRTLVQMPPRYWKSLPETAPVPDLFAQAETRLHGMAEAAPPRAPFFARALAARPKAPPPVPPEAGSLAALRAEEAACTRCPLHAGATQAVPGEGPVGARLMMVGEQPGDQEDLAGRPFVGPAGQLFDEALSQVGIDRRDIYLTNAVKHYKFTLKGERRIHQSPSGGEIAACRWWLAQEIRMVRPRLIVALGASAAEALTGSREGVLKRRGGIEEGPEGLPVFLTVHPSFLLRLPDPVAREMETERFRRDLAAAHEHLERLMVA